MFQMNVNLFFYGREEEGVCYDDLTDFDTSKSIRKLYLPFFISSNKSTLSPSKMYCSNHTNCNVSNIYHKIITRHFYATSKRNWFIINNNVPIFHFNLSATNILYDVTNKFYSLYRFGLLDFAVWFRIKLTLDENLTYYVYSCLLNESRLIVMSLNENTSSYHSYFYK